MLPVFSYVSLEQVVKIAFILLAVTASATTAHAQSTQEQLSDATCFRIAAASNVKMANNPSNPMALMSMYYLGRLEKSGANFDAVFAEVANDTTMTKERLQQKGNACISDWQAQVSKAKGAFVNLLSKQP